MPHDPSSPPWVIPWNSEGLSNESVRRSVELASMAFQERTQAPHSPALGSGDPMMRRRRAIVGLSLVGLASTVLASLRHLRVLRSRPKPNLHPGRTTASSSSDQSPLPDAMLSMITHAVNIVLARLGPESRTHRTPWLPIMAAGKAAADAGVAARYAVISSVADRAWSAYVVVDAAARMGTLACAIPEAVKALRAMLPAQPAERRSG